MEREEIVRNDFPTARKGWDPEAVTAHLESVAARLSGPRTALAEDASERVGAIVAAAEVAAAGLAEQAAREAEAALEGARAQAEEIVAAAREEAQGRLERAHGALEIIVSQAEDLRSRLAGPAAEVTPPAAPQPEPSPAPDPGPAPPAPGGPEIEPPAPEPTPEPSVPEPEPPVPEPGPDPEPPAPEPDPEPPAPEPPQPPTEPLPEPPETDPDPAAESTDALLAQLKSGIGAGVNGEAPDAETTVAAPGGDAGSSSNLAAARLVAMNLALQGEAREEIAARIRDELGQVEGLENLLDEVLARAGT